MNNEDKNHTTHFGYQEVPKQDKVNKVAGVFHSVAAKYDVMNDLMSMGVHRWWKQKTMAATGVRPGHQVLDLAGGTGDLALKFSRLVGAEGHVVLADINDSMLQLGRDKLIDNGAINNVTYVQADAECLPFAEHSFDCVTISFGLRNVTDKQAALHSMFRVLKPGARLLIMEFSKTEHPWLTKAYDTYSFNVLPKIGKWVADDEESYRYLAESIRMHPDQETLKSMMQQAGFVNCRYDNLTGGVVALHAGTKP